MYYRHLQLFNKVRLEELDKNVEYKTTRLLAAFVAFPRQQIERTEAHSIVLLKGQVENIVFLSEKDLGTVEMCGSKSLSKHVAISPKYSSSQLLWS